MSNTQTAETEQATRTELQGAYDAAYLANTETSRLATKARDEYCQASRAAEELKRVSDDAVLAHNKALNALNEIRHEYFAASPGGRK